MDVIRLNDPRLDESTPFLFTFKKGDVVKTKNGSPLPGEISDAVYIGKFPRPAAASVSPRGRTLYEITFADQSICIADEAEIQPIAPHG